MPADTRDMVLVPRVPTEAMMRAWNEAVPDAVEPPHADGWTPPADTTFRARWQAALSASPARGEGDAPVAWPDNDPRYEIDVTYEVWCGDNLEASATDLSEARRYAAQYQPCSLLIATTYRQPVDAPRARPTPATPEGLREAVRKVGRWVQNGMEDQSGDTPSREALRRDLTTILAALQPQAEGGSR